MQYRSSTAGILDIHMLVMIRPATGIIQSALILIAGLFEIVRPYPR